MPLLTVHSLRESRSRLTVLLAEDNPVNRMLATRLLQKRGHAVTAVEDGSEAVDAFKAGRFDIILMDVQMPRMDGFEATAAIRALEAPGGTRVPIVALTAHAMKGDRERCLASGMDEYLSKPLHPAELFDMLERLSAVAEMPEPVLE